MGSIAWWTDDAGTYTGSAGHVAYVERVNADGSIVVSEDNWGGTFHWKTHTAGYAWPNGFIHLKDVGGGAGVSEGQFVSFDDHVYRIADGAPVYVSSWNYFGGPQATTALSASRFAALRQYPLDGTFVSDQDGSVYRFAGGAPIYVSNFDHVGGTGGQPVTRVDKVALERTEPTGTWSHVSHRPADGTVLDAGGTKYVTAAGAPLPSTTTAAGTRIDLAAITNAGKPGVWAHLAAPTPAPALPPAPSSPTHPTALAPMVPASEPSANSLTMAIKAVERAGKLRVKIGPASAAVNHRFVVQTRRNGTWRRVVKSSTRDDRDVRVLNLGRGGLSRRASRTRRSAVHHQSRCGCAGSCFAPIRAGTPAPHPPAARRG